MDAMSLLEKIAISSPDAPFESAMASLAHSYLADRAPKLLDYEVGFQLLDRNEDGDRGVGVFAFKVGSTWLYAPVVFADGDLKGHELLYVKNQDMFVPATEDWINYLIGKKPSVLGQGISRELFQKGVRHPDFQQFSQSPTKFAEALAKDPVFGEVAVKFARLLLDDQPFENWPMSIPRFLEKEGAVGFDLILKVAEAYPAIGDALEKFYEAEELQHAFQLAKEAAATQVAPIAPIKLGSCVSLLPDSEDPHPVRNGRLLVYRYKEGQAAPCLLSDEDAANLRQNAYLIFDKRAEYEISKAYAVDTIIDNGSIITNPTETGLYDVLVKPGTVEKCVVLAHPHGPKGNAPFCTVFPVSGEKDSLNLSASNIWVLKQYPPEDWRKWWDEQSSAELSPTPEDRDTTTKYVCIGIRGGGTVPFEVEKDFGSNAIGSTYAVRYDDYARDDSDSGWYGDSGNSYDERLDRSYHEELLHLMDRDGAVLRSRMGEIYVPKEYKRVKVLVHKRYNSDGDYVSSPKPIQPGSMFDLQSAIYKTADHLKVVNDGIEAYVNDLRLPVKAAMLHLIEDHGFTEKAASCMLREAELARRTGAGGRRYFVKYANPFMGMSGMPGGPGMGPGPGSPAFPEPQYGAGNPMNADVSTIYAQSDRMPVTDMQANQDNSMLYRGPMPDPMAMQQAQQAAQTGQRELFDTAMLGTLLRTTRDDLMIDRHIGDIMKGMDKIGRILLALYWHPEKFSDRYGQQDMAELEDTLRNSFEQTGRLALFLKQKTVEPEVETGLNLDGPEN
jgi:hypothetical protein